MFSRVTMREYLPSVTGKPWRVMLPFAFDIGGGGGGGHNTAGFSCFPGTNILFCPPKAPGFF